MKRFLMLAALAAASAHAFDAPETVGVHLATAHARRGYNDVNPGIYARWGNGFTAGAYRNSEFRNSAYAGWTFTDSADRFALTVGAVSGYSHGVKPLIVPSVRLPITQAFSARLSLLAPYEKGTTAIHLSVEWRQ